MVASGEAQVMNGSSNVLEVVGRIRFVDGGWTRPTVAGEATTTRWSLAVVAATGLVLEVWHVWRRPVAPEMRGDLGCRHRAQSRREQGEMGRNGQRKKKTGRKWKGEKGKKSEKERFSKP